MTPPAISERAHGDQPEVSNGEAKTAARHRDRSPAGGDQAMTAIGITSAGQASSCYFRTTTGGGARKALIQIDERCNLHCAHCFVSATKAGSSMPYDDVTGLLIPRLAQCRVERVTLTGGEPTIHPQFLPIVRAFRDAGMDVGICTNATTLDDDQIAGLASIGSVHVNVSLDGFRPESHGRFRGDRGSFAVTVTTVRKLAAAGLLQGLLCTPNSLAEDEEYRELCEFATANGAAYVLMNPLSSMGRGVKARGKLASADEHMRRIHALTAPFNGPDLDVVHIRFPNTEGLPLAGCEAGTIIYVFTGGAVTVCPYLVFAARTPQSRHDPGEFIAGNIFTDPDIADRLDDYRFSERFQVGSNPTCASCGIAGQCGKGCPAAVIASGQRIGSLDAEVCPVAPGQRRLLPLAIA
jgi:radical SAM protein with 4Fe4S-binding SPASM domain